MNTIIIITVAIVAFILGFRYCFYIVRKGRRIYNIEIGEKLKRIKEGQAEYIARVKDYENSLKQRIAELEAENEILKTA